jgi:hypothetical protein
VILALAMNSHRRTESLDLFATDGQFIGGDGCLRHRIGDFFHSIGEVTSLKQSFCARDSDNLSMKKFDFAKLHFIADAEVLDKDVRSLISCQLSGREFLRSTI